MEIMRCIALWYNLCFMMCALLSVCVAALLEAPLREKALLSTLNALAYYYFKIL